MTINSTNADFGDSKLAPANEFLKALFGENLSAGPLFNSEFKTVSIPADARYISPLTPTGIAFLWRAVKGVARGDWAEAAVPPTAVLFKQDCLILCWALDMFEKPETVCDLVEAFSMGAVDETIPLPGVNGWELIYIDPNVFTTVDTLRAAHAPSDEDVEEIASLEDPAPSKRVAYEEGERFNDAFVRRRYVPTDTPITFTFGMGAEERVWFTKTWPEHAFTALLTRHKESSKKDGPAIVLGGLKSPGSRRADRIVSVSGYGWDYDNGVATEKVREQLPKLNCLAIHYTTHSHGITECEVSRKDVEKYANSSTVDGNSVRDYLLNDKHKLWEPSLVESIIIESAGETHFKIRMDPMPKSRVLVPFNESILIPEDRLEELREELRAKYDIVGAKLSLVYDTTCNDISRLFYLPRHAKGKPFEINIWGGPLFDPKTFVVKADAGSLKKSVGASSRAAVVKSTGAAKSITERGRALNSMCAAGVFRTFQITKFVIENAPKSREKNSGVEFECLNNAAHSKPREKKIQCFAQDAGIGKSEFCSVKCHHHSCSDFTFLDHIGMMMEDGWITLEDILNPANHCTLSDEGEPEWLKKRHLWLCQDSKKIIGELNKESSTEEPAKENADKNLSGESSTDDVRTTLAAIALIPDELERSSLLSKLGDKTGRDKNVLKKALKELVDEAQKNSPESIKLSKDEKLYSSDIEAEFPVPSKDYGNCYYKVFDGRPWLMRGKDTILHTPISVDALVVYADRHNEFGTRLKVMTPDGSPAFVEVTAPEKTIARGNDLIAKLISKGAGFADDGEPFLIRHVKMVNPAKTVTVVERPGWHGDAFVDPWGGVINADMPIELSADARFSGPSKLGTLEGQKAGLDAALRSGNVMFELGALMGFASPLLARVGLPSMTIGLTGATTKGKTTSIKIAASIWGPPGKGRTCENLITRLNSTVNATEVSMQRSSGCFNGLDEAHHLDGKQVEELIYRSSENEGRKRLGKDGNLRKSRGWSVLTAVTGEQALSDKIRSAQWSSKSAATGVTTRILEIQADNEKVLNSNQMGAIEAIYQNSGHAGAVFIQHIVDRGYLEESHLAKAIKDKTDKLTNVALDAMGDNAADQEALVRRSAQIAAVVWQAGEIAQEAGLIERDIDIAEIIDQIWQRARTSDLAAGKSDENAIADLYLALISRRGDDVVCFKAGEALETEQKRSAVAWHIEDFEVPANGKNKSSTEDVFVVPRNNLRLLAGDQLNARAIAAALDKVGALVRSPEHDVILWRYIKGVGKVHCYVIRAKAVLDEENKLEGAEGANKG